MRLPLLFFLLMLFGSLRVLPSSYQLLAKFSSLSLSLASLAVAPSNTVSASDGKNRGRGVGGGADAPLSLSHLSPCCTALSPFPGTHFLPHSISLPTYLTDHSQQKFFEIHI